MFNRCCFGALLLACLALTFTGCNTTPGLTTIVISPTTVNVTLAPPGYQQGQNQFKAIGYYGHAGHQTTADISNQVTWSSSGTQVATINSSGLATATGYNPATGEGWTGVTNITASAPGFNGVIVSNNATFTVTSCTSCVNSDISTVTVLPAIQTIATVGVPIQFEAVGNTVNGVSEALTSLPGIKWVSSAPSVATINAATGLATTVGSGTTTITATYTNSDGSGAVGSATLTVAASGSPEPLTALTVAPNAQTALSIGQTAQFLAIATTGSGTTVNLTNQSATVGTATIPAAKWYSSNPSVATINQATGVVTSVAAGASVITAIATNPDASVVTGAATYTVTVSGTTSSEPLVSLAIVPSSQTALAANQLIHFIVIGTTGSGTTVNLTNQSVTIGTHTIAAAAWSSSNPAVATIDPATGIATSHISGITAITAIAANPDGTVVTGSALFTVTLPSITEPYVSLAIVPGSQSVTSAGQTAQYIAIGTTGTGATVDLTSQATWASSVQSVATITGPGLAKAGTTSGVTAITAEYANLVAGTNTPDGTVVTGSATLTVAINATTEPLVSVSIVPSSQSVASPGQSSQLLAIGTFSATPITQDVTAGLAGPTSWTSNNPAITTSWSSSNTSVATVTTTCPTGLVAKSCTISLCPGSSSGGVCTSCPGGTVATGSSCATLNPTTPIGLVTGVNQGTAAIVVVASNPDHSLVTNTAPFTVVGGYSEQVTALIIIPGSAAATAPAQQNQFIALATEGGNGLEYDVTGQVVWRSNTPSVATICTAGSPAPCTPATDGLVTAATAGTTNITATWTNLDNSQFVAQATYTVTIGAAPEPLISINVVPSNVQVSNKGMTQQYLAFGTFTTTPTLRDITDSVTWITLNPNLVSINSAGTPGEVAGLATAMGYEGLGVIYAEGTNADNTVVLSNPVTFTCQEPGTSPPICDPSVAPALLATLTVFNAGSNSTSWLITAPSDTGQPDLIHCGPGSALAGLGNSVCTGTYAAGTNVTITASLAEKPLDNTFGGWTANCDTTIDVPNMTATCALPNVSNTSGLVGNQSVGALFYGLSLSCPAVTSGHVGVAFNSGALTASGGTGTYTFSVVGTLPTGLTLNTSTGAVTGTPTASGSFSITVTDANGTVAASNCTITII